MPLDCHVIILPMDIHSIVLALLGHHNVFVPQKLHLWVDIVINTEPSMFHLMILPTKILLLHSLLLSAPFENSLAMPMLMYQTQGAST